MCSYTGGFTLGNVLKKSLPSYSYLAKRRRRASMSPPPTLRGQISEILKGEVSYHVMTRGHNLSRSEK